MCGTSLPIGIGRGYRADRSVEDSEDIALHFPMPSQVPN